MMVANVQCTGLLFYDIFFKAADFDQSIVRFHAHARIPLILCAAECEEKRIKT